MPLLNKEEDIFIQKLVVDRKLPSINLKMVVKPGKR